MHSHRHKKVKLFYSFDSRLPIANRFRVIPLTGWVFPLIFHFCFHPTREGLKSMENHNLSLLSHFSPFLFCFSATSSNHCESEEFSAHIPRLTQFSLLLVFLLYFTSDANGGGERSPVFFSSFAVAKQEKAVCVFFLPMPFI